MGRDDCRCFARRRRKRVRVNWRFPRLVSVSGAVWVDRVDLGGPQLVCEIRDLNRHRTGTKYCPQVPRGFYCALDQLPPASSVFEKHDETLRQTARVGRTACERASDLLREREPSYIYWCLLGTEFAFEHLTTADKFIYEAELRTGLGAHFRYAKHLRDALALWYRRFPATRKLILEGGAEPE